MIEVQIYAVLSDYYIVCYGNTLYILADYDLLFDNRHVYTYPYKLTQEYHTTKHY